MKETMDAHIKVRKLDVKKGDTVLLHIPNEDRGKMDRKHLPCKIIDILGNGFYKLGCALGQLSVNYRMTDFNTVERSIHFPELDTIPEKAVSLRTAALAQSITQISGVKCNCKSTCLSQICACLKAKVHCSSNCHPKSNKCANRH
jgi:hypothetical protein